MSEKYRGWANWETWNVHLWLTNDEGSYELAKECESPEALKDMMESWADELELLNKGLFSDLITTSLNSVNWGEIHKSLKDE